MAIYQAKRGSIPERAHDAVLTVKCPVCGTAELVHDTRDMLNREKDRATLIEAVTGDFCPTCGESILEATESDRVMQELSGREGPMAGDADLSR